LCAQPAIFQNQHLELRYGETTTRARAARVCNANGTTFTQIRKKSRKQDRKQNGKRAEK
jgi:hypothetical protein